MVTDFVQEKNENTGQKRGGEQHGKLTPAPGQNDPFKMEPPRTHDLLVLIHMQPSLQGNIYRPSQ